MSFKYEKFSSGNEAEGPRSSTSTFTPRKAGEKFIKSPGCSALAGVTKPVGWTDPACDLLLVNIY